MTVGDRRAIERPQVADLIRDWIASNSRGIPYGRPQHPLGELGELGELGGFAVDASLKRTLTATPNVELALRGVPTQPATLDLDTVRQDASRSAANSSDASRTSQRSPIASKPPASPPPKRPRERSTASRSRSSTPTR